MDKNAKIKVSGGELPYHATWNRTWGGGIDDEGREVAVATDGVYVAGDTRSYGNGGLDALLVKYAPDGTQLWNRTWGDRDMM